LTLLIIAVVIVQTVRQRELSELWKETLVISLAHYFTSRRFVGLAPDVLKQLEAQGHIPKESNPLFLPRHTIRVLIVLAFAGLSYYVFREHPVRGIEDVPVVIITVAAYLLGVLARALLNRPKRSAPPPRSRLWEDLKALAVILVMLATALPVFLDLPDPLPEKWHSLALAFVLFYFGSR
jgi:hypothetical protein